MNSPQRNEEAYEIDGNATCYNNDDLRVVAAHRSEGLILGTDRSKKHSSYNPPFELKVISQKISHG